MGNAPSYQKYPSYVQSQTTTTQQTTPSHIKGRRALLVAISYSKTTFPLPGTQEDKTLVSETLKTKGFDNIVVMSDQDHLPESPYFPTYDNILRGLKWLLSSGTLSDFEDATITSFAPIVPNQTVFFYYSGHGSQVTDTSGDEKDGKDEVICPITKSGGWAKIDIRDDILFKLINDHAKQDTVMACVMDCCHSGTGMDLKYRLHNGRVSKYEDDSSPTKCTVILVSGSRDSQSAHEGMVGGGKKHGFLTWSWCKSVKERPNQSLYSLETSVKGKVLRLISTSRQIPTFSLGKALPISYKYPI